jgi:kynurenine formamidase
MDVRDYVQTVHAQSGEAVGQGSIRYIDPACVLRGAAAVSAGITQGIARIVRDEGLTARDGNALMTLVNSSMTLGGVEIAFDRLDMWAHGMVLTHLDAPNHVILDNVAPATGDAAQSDAAWLSWADKGFVTRAVFFDVPAHRGVPYVTADEPVTTAELAELEAKLDFALEPGDALLLYSGRDAFEAAWSGPGPAQVQAAVAQDATQWFAEHRFSLLCWDLLDSPPTENFGAHLLIWADGLAIVDNCDFSAAARLFRDQRRSAAMIAAGPLPVAGATGCLINPVLTF